MSSASLTEVEGVCTAETLQMSHLQVYKEACDKNTIRGEFYETGRKKSTSMPGRIDQVYEADDAQFDQASSQWISTQFDQASSQ